MSELGRTFPEGTFIHNLLQFGQVLRSVGIEVPPFQMGEVLSALQYIDITSKPVMYFSLRSLLISNHQDYPVFEKAFHEFWKTWHSRWLSMTLPPVRTSHQPESESRRVGAFPTRPPVQPSDEDEPGQPPKFFALETTYSQVELLRQRDFSSLTEQEIKAVYQLISELKWTPAQRKTRRFRAGEGRQLDFRRTFRRNLRFGSEILLLQNKTPRRQTRPLIVLADVSGSMQAYSKILLHFIFSLTARMPHPVESFIFSTQLTRISPFISLPRIEQAMRALSSQVRTWSGGTRIGASLRTFNIDWAWRLNAQKAVVLLISDGWDRGNPQDLGREMAHLQRCTHQLIWLNPLLGSAEYQPLTRGMQAALPYIDRFLPVHNLASLEDLAQILSASLGSRPRDRQFSRGGVYA